MNLQVQGNPIPRTDHIRILGLHLQVNGSNTISLQCIDQSVVQIGRLLKRVSNKHPGMRESNLLRLVQAFICSRITYSAPYLRLTCAETNGWRRHFANHTRQHWVFPCPQPLTSLWLSASPTP
ncbi:hypothetical protein MTO96_046062 [Rhipicephalus appendiculatus]